MAIKIAKAMGAHVVVFTTSLSKAEDARRLGADEVVLSTDAEQMKKQPRLDMILDTQEVLDFCALHNITAEIELINVDQINEAFERLEKGDVHYRFVIDLASLRNPQ